MTDIKEMYRIFDNDESDLPISILDGSRVMGAIHYIDEDGRLLSKASMLCIPVSTRKIILSVPEHIKVEIKEMRE